MNEIDLMNRVQIKHTINADFDVCVKISFSRDEQASDVFPQRENED